MLRTAGGREPVCVQADVVMRGESKEVDAVATLEEEFAQLCAAVTTWLRIGEMGATVYYVLRRAIG